jgi:hypothetical protein
MDITKLDAKTFWHIHSHDFKTYMVANPDKIVFEGENELWRFMEEYAQYKQKEPERPRELSNKEIEKWAEIYEFVDYTSFWDAFVDGAACYRDRDQLSPKAKCSNCGKVHEYSALSCYDKIGRKT